jgi:hypothetical protein
LVILYFSKFFCEETLPNRNGKSIIYAHLYKLNVTKNTKTIENSSKSTLIFKAVDVFRSQIHNVLQASNGSSITIATSTILVSQFLLYTFFFVFFGREGGASSEGWGNTFSFYSYFSIVGNWCLGWDIGKVQLFVSLFRNCGRNFGKIFDCKLLEIIRIQSIGMPYEFMREGCIYCIFALFMWKSVFKSRRVRIRVNSNSHLDKL